MKRIMPVIVLFVLSPLIAELMFGATTVSNLGALIPTSLLYGGGAILIRELARRRGPGWRRIALLGAAYAVVEEGIALESMFNPGAFNAGLVGGRLLGVNWVWTEWTIGYHVVWSISLPILLAEILFPDRRDEPWLRWPGVVVAGVLFALGATALALIFRMVIAPDFHLPAGLLIGAALAVIILVALALALPTGAQPAPTEHAAPSPWLVGASVGVVALTWFTLLDIPHVLRDSALVLLPMLIILGLAVGIAVLLRRWSAARGWGDLHRLAIVFGALLVSACEGFFLVTAGNALNQAGQAVISLLALALLAVFTWRRSRTLHTAAS